jgi:hypothetical protein
VAIEGIRIGTGEWLALLYIIPEVYATLFILYFLCKRKGRPASGGMITLTSWNNTKNRGTYMIPFLQCWRRIFRRSAQYLILKSRESVILWGKNSVLRSVKPGGICDMLEVLVKIRCPTSSKRVDSKLLSSEFCCYELHDSKSHQYPIPTL